MKSVLIAIVVLGNIFSATCQNSISGRVTNESGEALIGATVRLHNTMVLSTNAEGLFKFKGLADGKYQLSISYVGYENHIQDILLSGHAEVEIFLKESILKFDEIIVFATRANDKTPTTYSNISKEKIVERNLGQDLPILLNYTPSLVSTSDAGSGIGYSGMRIRGSAAERINVTVNGIPLNDSESHSVFWVNMPDFASSVNSIQVQRGLGTSSHGAAAFGATVNLQTSSPSQKGFAQIDNSIGSFNTWKSSITYNTGMLNSKFNFEGRLSKISSEGFVDRSASDLKSYFLSGGYFGSKSSIKMLVFGGQEITDQAWYGTPEARLSGNANRLQEVIDFSGEYTTQEQVDNLLNSDRRFNYYLYDNEIDNYSQNHYQLHLNTTLSKNLNFSGALHYTKGKGYFEQFRNDDALTDYSLENVVISTDTISHSDLIRRRWLENDFYGFTYAFNYDLNNLELTLGGGANQYVGDHFGQVIWAKYSSNGQIRHRYYDGVGTKNDLNTFLKINYQLGLKLNLFGDAQLRILDYKTDGTDNDLLSYDIKADYLFFNPKVGLTYSVNQNGSLYASYGIGNKEPKRSDFIDAPNGSTPKPETLGNLEIGYRSNNPGFSYELNYYLMRYWNQLVLTGELNDVGSAIQTNVPNSYRTGIELVGAYEFSDKITWSANIAFSQNRIRNFTEIVYDYGTDFNEYQVIELNHDDSDISFSPNVVAGSDIIYTPLGGFNIQLLTKYVGDQYLDNTSNKDRSIDSYFVNDLRLSYEFSFADIEKINISFMINNILNEKYESNGYTWGYSYGEEHYQQNNYYPQAGVNFLAGLSLRF